MALKLFFIFRKLLIKKYNSSFSEYRIRVPNIIVKTPRYCFILRVSPNKINANIELNRGEKDRRGMVKLNSDSFIDLRKINAEKIPKSTSVNPGIK